MRGLSVLYLLQCNTLQKDIKELKSKNELLEQELKQAKERVTTATKVILIYLVNRMH
jgi:cell division septum initiation protein DivIVA